MERNLVTVIFKYLLVSSLASQSWKKVYFLTASLLKSLGFCSILKIALEADLVSSTHECY